MDSSELDENTTLLADFYQNDKSNSDESYTRKDLLCHILMILLLIQIVMLYIKNYFTKYATYSYLLAFALPMMFICLISTDIIYEKYVAKLQRNHALIYNKFLGLLVLFTISAVMFFVLLSCFLS